MVHIFHFHWEGEFADPTPPPLQQQHITQGIWMADPLIWLPVFD